MSGVLKTIFALVFIYTLSAQALGGFFSAKVGNKEFHFYTDFSSTSYLYQLGFGQMYVLKNETAVGATKTYEIFESNQQGKASGSIKITDGKLESLELGNVKAKNVKLKNLNLPVEMIPFRKQIYNNDKCSFRFVDMNNIEDMYLFKESSFLISEIMDAFKDYKCDYLKSSKSNETKDDLNQVSCDTEALFLKKRFYGITFICKAHRAKSSHYKYQIFSVIYDKSLKARVTKSDFTGSDIKAEDDYAGLEFRLTPLGLGLYSSVPLENKEEYVRIIPYIGIKKHFSIWGKPKRYLSNFAVK